MDVLYIFIDEAGNLDFSNKGTEYFILTSLSLFRPFAGYKELVSLRYDLVEFGYDLEGFHASEDRQPVRDRVFGVISDKLESYRIDALIIEKRKTGPALQKDVAFYPQMIGYLLRFVIKKFDLTEINEIIVVTDTIPLKRKRNAIQGEVKSVLKEFMPKNKKFRVMHHSSKSNICLQITDYCCWAIFRKWEQDDERSYKIIKNGVKSEFSIFRRGKRDYY